MNKKLVLTLPLLISLSGCSVVVSSSTLTSSSQATSSSSSISNISSSSISSSTNEEVEDIYKKDAYKNISIDTLDTEARVIDSKDDVTYDDLFNLKNKININVEIEPSELTKIQKDYETGYKNQAYRIAKKVTISLTNYSNTFTWEFDEVGIRQKGNTSRTDVYKDGKVSNLNHFKLSFDETFDYHDLYGDEAKVWTDVTAKKEREDREFLGLSGLDLKWNKSQDRTYIKEIYASRVYRAAGIISQHVGLSTFSINETNGTNNQMGLYILYEPDSKSLIKRSLQNGSFVNMANWKNEKKGIYGVEGENYGDLYDCSYGVGEGSYGNGADLSLDSISNKRVGVENNSGSYIPVYKLKTNKTKNTGHTRLKDLIQTINSAELNDIENKVDLEYFAITEACNYIIGNPDNLRNNNNNYMIYIRRTDGKAIIIPIDNDRCFGITKDYNPDGNAMMNRDIFTTKAANGKTSNLLYAKTILASTPNKYKAIYLNYIKALKNSDWMNPNKFDSLYQIAYETYGNESTITNINSVETKSVSFSNIKENDDVNETFMTYVSNKTTKIDLNYVIKSVAGELLPEREVYLIGSFNNWSQNKDMPLTYNSTTGDYSITFTPQNVDNGKIKLKFFDGVDYSALDWSINDDLTLNLDGNGKSYQLNNVTTNSVITIVINPNTLKVTISIN